MDINIDNQTPKIHNAFTNNKDIYDDLRKHPEVVGGNIIANPNPDNFRNTDYIVLTNEDEVTIHVCPPNRNVKTNCKLPIEEPLKLFNKRTLCVKKMDYHYQTQKVINKKVRTDSSLQTSIFASKMYIKKNDSLVKKRVPTRGNSTKYSITALRPGSTSAIGKGVHKKHGSYERRLLDLKKKCLC